MTKNWFFFDLDRNISESHMTIKRLTKFDFSHVSSIFNPFWSVYVDMENPYKSEIWVQKSVFSTIFGFPVEYSTDVEISTWKFFFEKFTSSATFFIFIICAQNAYLWSYEPLKSYVKSPFLAKITSKIATCGFTERTVDEIIPKA